MTNVPLTVFFVDPKISQEQIGDIVPIFLEFMIHY